MSGVCRMQELKYFRDGATLVISLDGLNWLSKRRCSDEGIKKRDEALQLLKSAGQMIQADEDLQPITCVCILDQRGSAGPQLWRNSHCRSSLVTQAQPFSIPPRHCCLPEEPTRHSTFPFLASFVSECPKGTPWTRLILNMQDVFSLIKKTLNTVTQQVTTDWHNSFIIFCDEDIPLQRFGDTCHTEDYRTSVEDSGWHISDNNMLSDLKNSTALWPHGPNTINSRVILHELVSRDNFNTCNLKSLLKSRQIYDAPGVLSGKDTNVKKRKSVSFDDDVTVYLFDQESPTLELHTGPHTSLPSNYSCNPSDVTLEDSGLEWEDDFSALEKDCHFQCVRHSVSQHYHLPVPTQSCTALSRPERFFLSQTFLFLTHVTESDLEL